VKTNREDSAVRSGVFVNEAKYLGMNLDVRLKWKAHIKKKKE
jgi:hypothetical protein